MMRLLPTKESTGRGGEPVISLICGVPALGIGLGAMVLLLSYLADVPIGSKNFYQVENIPVEVPREWIGQVITSIPIKRIIPSVQLQGMILVGMCSAALGVYLSRRRWPRRQGYDVRRRYIRLCDCIFHRVDLVRAGSMRVMHATTPFACVAESKSHAARAVCGGSSVRRVSSPAGMRQGGNQRVRKPAPHRSPGAPRRFPNDLMDRPSCRKWRDFREHSSFVQSCGCRLATLGVPSSQRLTHFHVTLWSIKSFVKHFSQSPG